MFDIKANPLRVSSTVFTGIIIIMLIAKRCVPGDYTVHINESLSENISGNPVTLKELQTLLSQEEHDFLLVDIRTPQEFANGHLKDAVNIPTADLLDKKSRKQLRKQPNILYCSTEAQAHASAYLLNQCGYDCRPVNGNYDIIKKNVVDKFVPAFGSYSDEKQQYDYPAFIKQSQEAPEFEIDKKEEVKTQGGC